MKPNVLIVDDEQQICHLLEVFLEGEGFEIDCAADIQGASALMADKRYDLVFADLTHVSGRGCTAAGHLL